MAETPRRSTRKRRASTLQGAATKEGVHAAITNALESAGKLGSNKAKRRRTVAHAHKPPFETIPDELLPTIMLFLDSARDVYNLANCSKRLRRAITPEVVVRSAVFSGGKTRGAIADVMDAVKKRNVHVPSTLRLLRLVNAKKCERMEECFAYDLVKKVSGDCSKNGMRPFGLAICQDCVRNCSSNIVPRYNRDHFARNDRVAWHQNSRILYDPYTEVATGERAGPFIFVKNVLQIKKSYTKEEDMKQALTSIIEQVDENTTSSDEERAKAFLDAHETAEEEFAALEQGEKDAKAAERAAKKIKKVRAAYAKLEHLLDGYAHKDLVLECSWDERSGTCTLKHTLARQNRLGGLLNAPRGATRKNLTAASESVREIFDLVQAKGFIGPNFLSFLSDSQLRHERALHQYCQMEKTSSALLSHKNADHRFLGLLRADKLVLALLRVLDSQELKFVFSRGVAAENIASARQAGDVTQQDSQRIQKLLRKLAIGVWCKKVPHPWLLQGAGSFRQKYAECRSEFMILAAAARRYTEDPQTVAFLSETGPPPNHPNQVFTRQNAVDMVYDYEKHLTFYNLRDENFEELRDLHKRIFLNPSLYGLSRNNGN